MLMTLFKQPLFDGAMISSAYFCSNLPFSTKIPPHRPQRQTPAVSSDKSKMSARPPTQRFTSAERAFKMPSKTATNPTSDRKRPLLGSKDQQQMFNAKVPIVRVEGHFFPKPMSSKPTKERTIGTAGQREEKAYKLAYDEQLCTNFPLMRLVIDIGQNENGVSSLPADRRLALEEVRSLIHFDKANRALPLFVNECLSYCLKFNRPLVGISLVRLLIADDLLKISRVTVNLATRILTLLKANDLDFVESERIEVVGPIRRECEYLKIVGTLNYASTSLELLLNACDVADGNAKEWRLDLLDREFPERNQIFFLLAAIAIARRDIGTLRMLTVKSGGAPLWADSTRHPLFHQLLAKLKESQQSEEGDQKRLFSGALMSLLMEQLCALTEPIEARIFDDLIHPAILAYGRWPLKKTPVHSQYFCGGCGICLSARPIPDDALDSLKHEFRRLLDEAVQSSITTPKEMAHFQQVLKEIRAQVCVERRPLILDAENMFGGRYIIKEDRKAWFCKTLIDLVGEHDYGPVLIVSKKSWLSAKLRQLLQSIRPTFLAVEARSNHDLFILNAAFELDPSATHILTNDHIVSNHRFLLDPLAKSAFDAYYRSHVINFDRMGKVKIPNFSRTVLRSPNGHYHLHPYSRTTPGLTPFHYDLYCLDASGGRSAAGSDPKA